MIYISQILEEDKLEEIINKYDVGLEIISFSIYYVLDDVDEYIKKYKHEFLKYKNSSGFTFHGPFLDMAPATFDTRIRELVLERFNNCYKASQEFNVSKIVYHSGYTPNTYIDKYWLENIINFWREFLKDKNEKTTFYIENVLDKSPYLLKEIIDNVGCDNLKICLDIGHVNAYSNIDIYEWIEVLQDRIGHVHIHNNNKIKDEHKGINNGTLDVINIIKNIKKYSKEVEFTLEVSDYNQLCESIEILKKYIDGDDK